jgi:hypothetical protein
MSFKVNVEQIVKNNDIDGRISQIMEGLMMLSMALTDLENSIEEGGGSVRNVYNLHDVGGAGINTEPSGTLVYSLNQTPGQITLDSDGDDSPPIGTEYVIYAGSPTGDGNTGIYLQTQKANTRIQISGTPTNTTNLDVSMGVNSKCTVTKVSNTLWVVQGDSLSYIG